MSDVFSSIRWRVVHEPRMWVSEWVGEISDSWKPFAIRVTPHFCTDDVAAVRAYSVNFFHDNIGILKDHFMSFGGDVPLSRVGREAVLNLWQIIDSNTINLVGDDFMQTALVELNSVVGTDSKRSLLFDLGCAFVESARLDNLCEEMGMADQEYVPEEVRIRLRAALEQVGNDMDAMREHILELIPGHILDHKHLIDPSQYRSEISPAWVDRQHTTEGDTGG